MKAAELIVPIPELEDGSPDWRVVQQVELQLSFIFQLNTNQVWWDMHDVVARFEAEDKYPVDLAVEDRCPFDSCEVEFSQIAGDWRGENVAGFYILALAGLWVAVKCC